VEIEGVEILENLFSYACKRQQDAIRYCMCVWRVCHFWDDIIDGDPVTKQEANEAMSSAMVEINRNPFFKNNIDVLNGVVSLIVANWHVANEYEAAKHHLEKAYMLRAYLYNLPIICAFIIDGQPWANQVAKVAWESYGETFQSFIEEIENA